MPPEISRDRLPFAEQIAFFRGKLNLPTAHYDDILKSAHDRVFMVAGAQQADLVQDLRTAVDGAIADGKSIQWFRERFDAAVAQYGWDYRGPRDWRTRVIYTTNMATSYAAGRYEQLQHFEYWRYKHNDSVRHPRPLHVSWDGLVLPKSDPWWQTHFPPNGWGCRCRAIAATPNEFRKAGKNSAPDDGTYEQVDRYGERHVIPNGIDYGWDYAPGARAHDTWSSLMADKLVRWDADLGARVVASMIDQLGPIIANDFKAWGGDVLATRQIVDELFTVGAVSPKTLDFLSAQAIQLENAAVTIRDRELLHLSRAGKTGRGAALADEDILRLPDAIARPAAVLWDTQDPALIYVMRPASGERVGKIVVRVDYATKTGAGGQRAVVKTNSVRTAGSVAAGDLTTARYQIVEGGVGVMRRGAIPELTHHRGSLM